MRKSRDVLSGPRQRLLTAAGLMAVTAAVLIVFGIASAMAARAQSQTQSQTAASPPKFEFDVATIRPAKDPAGGWKLDYEGDTLRGSNVSLLYVVKFAFGTYEDNRILSAPKWLDSATYDIAAKIDAPTMDALEKLQIDQQELTREQMLQDLLAERFQLATHRETKELPVYFLVVGKNGPKLAEAKPDPNAPKGPVFGGTVRSTGTTTTGKWIASSELADWLSGQVGRTVLDKTGLTGKYDFSLQYIREQDQLQTASNQPDSNFPPLFTAIQEQLGLKLESGKGPVEIIVIDHIERPSGN